MTHEELLAKIKTPNEFLGIKYAPDWQHVALLAVVELHKPDSIPDWVPTEVGFICGQCAKSYPCQTIQAIEKELG